MNKVERMNLGNVRPDSSRPSPQLLFTWLCWVALALFGCGRADLPVGDGFGSGPYEAGAPARCGDGRCDDGETRTSCGSDCRCGDHVCSVDETHQTCASDCSDTCGDGKCEDGEKTSCPNDCRPAACGDGVCSGGENANSCSTDCHCGDGFCDSSEVGGG